MGIRKNKRLASVASFAGHLNENQPEKINSSYTLAPVQIYFCSWSWQICQPLEYSTLKKISEL